MHEPRYLCGLSNSVEMVRSERVIGMFLGEPETMEREGIFGWLQFQVHVGCQNGQLIYETLVGALVCRDQVKIVGVKKEDGRRILEVIADF